MTGRSPFLALAALSALSFLAACSEEPAVQAPPEATPRAESPAPEPQKPALETAKEGIDKLRQAAEQAVDNAGPAIEDAKRRAEQAMEDAKPALEEARKRVDQAIEDAGPALDRAKEIAGDIGTSVQQLAARAREEFDRAVADLEKRIGETDGPLDAPTAAPEALLPAEGLRADTRAAARARQAGIGPDFVGVWAADAASCGRIDREPVELFAVITPSTIRRTESVCNFESAPEGGSNATVTASCIAEGDVEERPIAFVMADENSLAISTPGQDGTAQLIRCRLPG